MKKGKFKLEYLLKMILAILLTAVVVVSGLALAKYTTRVVGKGNANVASWSFKVNGSSEEFKSVKLVDTINSDKMVENVIAPGTEGKLEIQIDARGSEVAIEYYIQLIDFTEKPTNLKFYADENYENPLQEIENGLEMKGYIPLEEVETVKVSNIYWKWDYRTGDTEEEKKANDIIDTKDIGKDTTMKLKVIGIQAKPGSDLPKEFPEKASAINVNKNTEFTVPVVVETAVTEQGAKYNENDLLKLASIPQEFSSVVKLAEGESSTTQIETKKLTPNDITIVVDGEEINPGTKELYYHSAQDGKDRYILKLQGVTGEGTLQLNIKNNEKIETTTTEVLVDNTSPELKIETENTNLTKQGTAIIEVSDNSSGVIQENFEYYLSTSKTELAGGTWKTYESGVGFEIGVGETGLRFIFIKPLEDKAGNIANGDIKIGGTSYIVDGPYMFDNTPPKVGLTGDVEKNDNDGTYKIPLKIVEKEAYITDDEEGKFESDDIVVKVAGNVIEPVKLDVEYVSENNGEYNYNLVLMAKEKGNLSLEIPTGTVGDIAGNENSVVEISTNFELDGLKDSQGSSEENPYIITTAEQLANMNNDLCGYYKLGADIDLSSYDNWTPIGNSTNKFTGSLDGAGFTISNLKITGTNSYRGLFGYNIGTIKNLALENVNIEGKSYIGAIAGYNGGTIEKSYATGSVTSTSYYAGGLIGYCNSKNVKDVFAVVTVNGYNSVGGIIGSAKNTTLTNAYSIGSVTGKSALGALIGKKSTVSVVSSYYSKELSGLSDTGVANTPTKRLFNEATFVNWDFENIWQIEELNTTPYLRNMKKPSLVSKENISFIDYSQGSGTVEDPYIIKTKEELQSINNGLNLHYKLGADIDLSSYENWTPIGNSSNKFTGSLDGAEYKITNLKTTGSSIYRGLFGYNAGTVTNIKLENVNISGGSYTGGLAGYSTGTVTSCNVTGTIKGTGDETGGLIGYNTGTVTLCYTEVTASGSGIEVGGLIGCNKGTVVKCYSVGEVTAVGRNAGGLLGYSSGTVTDTYAAVKVTGSTNVGSLIGRTAATIKNSYSLGQVTGTSYTGGLTGRKDGGSATNSYWTKEKSGQVKSSLGERTLIERLVRKAGYTNWDFENTWQLGVVSDGKEKISTAYLKELPAPTQIYGEGLGEVDLGKGSGTEDDPFIIKTAEDLANVNNYLSGYYKVVSDIDLSSYENWTPIGNSANKFTGNLDGAGYTISNLTITGSDTYRGLFGYNAGTIKNLKLDNANVSGGDYTGILTGYNTGTVDSLEVKNANVAGSKYIGGLAGYNTGNMVSSSYNGVVAGSVYIGGLTGYNKPGTITLCYSVGTVTGEYYVGGLVGSNGSAATINRSYSTVNVQATSTNTKGETCAGGLVGYNSGQVTNSFATGSVKGVKSVGGLLGGTETGTVKNNYSLGKVEATSNPGGLISLAYSGTITNSYWSTETSGVQKSAAGTSKMIQQLLEQSTYENWDFTDIWCIEDNGKQTTAYLRGLPIPTTVYEENIQYIKYEGNGTEENPYIIKTKEQLENMNNMLNAHYRLANNIDLSSYENWTPIGNSTNKFTGSLDGAGYTISNLNITGSSTYVGLFGYNAGTIKNVKLENVNVSGADYIGSLVGYSTGTVSNCSSNGTITGGKHLGGLIGYKDQGTIELCYTNGTVTGDWSVGGLVGNNMSGTINKSYSATNVEATSQNNGYTQVGGIVGYNNATISNSFATGKVTGISNSVGGLVGRIAGGSIQNCYAIGGVQGTTKVGGLVGEVSKGTTTNSYWSPERSNQVTSAAGTVTPIQKMVVKETYTSWDFDSIWQIGVTKGENEEISTPYLKELPIPISVYGEGLGEVDLTKGMGTEEDPYIIKTAQELENMKLYLNAYYRLANNIDLSSYENWTPIGNSTNKFTGGLDGAGYTISNLKITGSSTYRGLFGYNTGTIKNLKLDTVNVSGGNYTGILAGYSTGTVTSCNVTGTIKVTGSEYVGGLIGCNKSGRITLCYSVGTVTGYRYVGGLVGRNEYGTIDKSYSTANVQGTDTGNMFAGGLVGYSEKGDIRDAFATGNVVGAGRYTGGLVGQIYYGSVTNSYSIGNVRGTSYVGGLAGSGSATSSYWSTETSGVQTSSAGTSKTLQELLQEATYTNWDFVNTWAIEEGTTTPYIRGLEIPDDIYINIEVIE